MQLADRPARNRILALRGGHRQDQNSHDFRPHGDHKTDKTRRVKYHFEFIPHWRWWMLSHRKS
jgi:hypothetical protein